MDITISVSEKTAEIIRHKAEETGKDVSKLVEEVLEEKFFDDAKEGLTADGDASEKRERKHNLLKFAGMFSSGKTDTSERMHEILYSEDFDPAEGFNVK